MVPVVCPPEQGPDSFEIGAEAYVGPGRIINSRFLDGMSIEEAKTEMARRMPASLSTRTLGIPCRSAAMLTSGIAQARDD